MINLEYHKGSFCVYTSVFCQEGYCSGCEVYGKSPLATEQVDQREGVKSQKTHQPVLVH
jgi:hypothetical protein